MKAKELIEVLQKLDPETLVLVDGYEGGYTELNSIREQEVGAPIVREWYYGEYDNYKEGELFKYKAILLSR
jgi:hypothetical protein